MRFEAHASKGKSLLLLAGCLLFIVAGLWFLISAEHIAATSRKVWMQDPWLVRGLGAVCVLFFGMCGLGYARQLGVSEPVVEVDERGILWRRWSDTRIPWSAIRRAGIGTMSNQQFLSLWLVAPERYRSTGMLGWLQGMNKSTGFGDITVNLAGADRSMDELIDAVAEHAPQLFQR